jgi:hypothetical protein
MEDSNQPIGMDGAVIPAANHQVVVAPATLAAEPAVAAPPVAARAPRPNVIPIQVQFVLDLPSLREFQTILTIPTVGTELEKAEGMSFKCRQDRQGVLLPGDETVTFAMKSLTVWQLRRFAHKFNVPQSLMVKRSQCFINLMTAFLQNPDSVQANVTRQAAANQIMLDQTSIGTNRLISTLFGSTYRALYAQLNNNKDHADYEITFGANNKIFWNNVVDSVNHGDEEEDVKHKLLPCKDTYVMAAMYRGYMDAAVNEDPSLPLPVQVTVKGVKETISYLLKTRKTIETNMHTKTGSGEPDVMKFTQIAQGKLFAFGKSHCFRSTISIRSVPSIPKS